jgi:hypothetical protein
LSGQVSITKKEEEEEEEEEEEKENYSSRQVMFMADLFVG